MPLNTALIKTLPKYAIEHYCTFKHSFNYKHAILNMILKTPKC